MGLILREGVGNPSCLVFYGGCFFIVGVLMSHLALCQPSIPKRTVFFPTSDATRFVVWKRRLLRQVVFLTHVCLSLKPSYTE